MRGAAQTFLTALFAVALSEPRPGRPYRHGVGRGGRVISGSEDRTVRVWDLHTF